MLNSQMLGENRTNEIRISFSIDFSCRTSTNHGCSILHNPTARGVRTLRLFVAVDF